MSILRVENLKKYYGKGESLVKALDDVNMEVKEGEFISLVGASGSGKSTLLNMIGGLDYPSEGKVYINGIDIGTMNKKELTIFRRRNIGVIFQDFNLIPSLSVRENIVLPIGLDNNKVDESYLKDLMKTLEIEHKEKAMPSMLSGGQQQKVAIGRALISRPAIILADEPTGNLDSKTSLQVMRLLKTSIKKYNQTLILITHDNYIAQMGDRIIRINDGKLISEDN